MQHWIWQHKDWPQFKWNNSILSKKLAQCRKQQGKLSGIKSFLTNENSKEIIVKLFIDESVNTSAIEGEKIDDNAVRSSILNRLGLKTFGLPKAPRHVDQLIEILYDATTNFSQKITFKKLFSWQAALFPTGYSGLAKIKTGQLRGEEPMQVVSGAMGKEKVHFEAPPHHELKKQVTAFLEWFNHPPVDLDGIIRAGIAHLWFVTLHPFADGNGRLTRALTDMALAQDEKSGVRLFSLSLQIMKKRNEYYHILEKTQKNGLDITLWLEWFLDQLLLACQNSEKIMDSILIKTKFWIEHKNLDINERQKKVLNCMLDNLYTNQTHMQINTRKYSSITKTSRSTAYREIAYLNELNILISSGSGRSTCYILNLN